MSEEQDITKLQQSNEELKGIINNSWDGIGIIDLKAKLIYFNNAFMPILGYKKEELLNINFITLIEDAYKKPFVKFLKNNLANSYDSDMNIVCMRKDKQKVYLKVTISLMKTKKLFVINAKDITKEISDDEILDNYVISAHVNSEGKIIASSLAFCNLIGYSSEDLKGKDHSIIKHEEEDDSIFDDILKNIKEKKEWKGKIQGKKKNNTSFWVDLKVKPTFNKYGDITGYTALMFDITNEINLNVEAKSLQQEVIVKDNLIVQQSKLAIMNETLQMLSHEWRQPLNVISIRAQKLELDFTLGETPKAEDIQETLKNIKEDAQKLSDTIQEFQNFTELRSSKTEANSKEIILKAIEIFKGSPGTNEIDIIKDIEDTPAFNTYKNEVTTILVNILINSKEAFQRKDKKNGVIKLKEYHIDNKIFFEISDNAGGINEDIIEKVFEPYFSTKEKKHGVGLGLYTCKIITEMHLGGTIEVQNHNTGATFKISLPMN